MLTRLFEEAAGKRQPGGAEPTASDHARARTRYVRSGGGTPPPGATPLGDDV